MKLLLALSSRRRKMDTLPWHSTAGSCWFYYASLLWRRACIMILRCLLEPRHIP